MLLRTLAAQHGGFEHAVSSQALGACSELLFAQIPHYHSFLKNSLKVQRKRNAAVKPSGRAAPWVCTMGLDPGMRQCGAGGPSVSR